MIDSQTQRKWKWQEWAFWVQVAANLLALGVVIAILLSTNARSNLLTLRQSEENHSLLARLEEDINIHAHASTNRVCAVAREIEFLVEQTPDVSVRISKKVREFTDEACTVVPIGPSHSEETHDTTS